MKTNLLLKKSLSRLLPLLCMIASSMMSQAQTSLELSFTNSSLYSGTAGQDNAVYRFQNVNNSLDAFVKISGRSSSLVKLDNIDLTSTGFSKAFQPQVSYNNGSTNSSASWWMEFEISFVNKNTTTPATVSTFKVTALDIDGDNNNLKEWDALYGLDSYTLENNSLLQVSDLTQTVQNVVQVVGKTFTGVTTQYSGIDTAQTRVMATSTYNNTSVFKLRFGATTTGSAGTTGRMYSAWFKNFTYSAPVISTLPVSLVSLTATLNNNKADLKWTTASEVNVSHFVIEKSYDGKNFSDAGLVFAYGSISEKANYSFSDNVSSSQNTVIYYRLRSVDNDGKSQYSEIRIIRISKKGEAFNMTVYPNPVSSELRVTVPAEWQGKAVMFELFNQNGQKIKAKNSNSSNQTETIMVNDLSKGLYLVKATCGSDVTIQKVIKN
jgi:Secretion system C-terminal sorting domain